MDIVLGRVLSGAGLLLILGAAIIPFIALTYLMPGTQIQLVLLGMGFVFMMGLLTILLRSISLGVWKSIQFCQYRESAVVFNAHSRDICGHGCGIGFVESTSTSELEIC